MGEIYTRPKVVRRVISVLVILKINTELQTGDTNKSLHHICAYCKLFENHTKNVRKTKKEN